ncbi:hypothetical protein L1987_15719 [Smallanthus sonchifolius]|uniref:Uncharacterized protein n=1 Tax=Smallanthus sonchifolius TaxID=185202 RepID=A0ACB9J779_9ASTR|nr:hypothetical protein L1987_15719 [Smallanthus sonchifolius]
MIEDSSSSYSSGFKSKPSVAYGLRRSSTGSGANFVAGLHKDTPAAPTPKKIGELMQVDGLTSDEVKSHLFPSSNASSANQSGGALGDGLGMPPQDQDVESSKSCVFEDNFVY